MIFFSACSVGLWWCEVYYTVWEPMGKWAHTQNSWVNTFLQISLLTVPLGAGPWSKRMGLVCVSWPPHTHVHSHTRTHAHTSTHIHTHTHTHAHTHAHTFTYTQTHHTHIHMQHIHTHTHTHTVTHTQTVTPANTHTAQMGSSLSNLPPNTFTHTKSTPPPSPMCAVLAFSNIVCSMPLVI